MKNFKVVYLMFIVFNMIQIKAVLAQSDLSEKPPTLQIGLDGLSFSKGSLDAQLIMEIIAEKQEEIKIKAIQNIFLKKVENTGGVVYTFTDNVVRELIFEKDPKVRTRKIIENTVNIVFVSSYLNYFLSTRNTQQIKDIENLYNKIVGPQDSISLDDSKSLSLASFVKKKNRESKSSFLDDKKSMYFISLLLDMCSEVIKKDEKLKQLGLMQISYSATYDFLNKYNQLKINLEGHNSISERHPLRKLCWNSNRKIDSDTIVKIQKLAENLFTDMKNALTKITDYIGLVNYIVDEYSFRNDNLEYYIESIKNKSENSTLNKVNIINELSFLDTKIEKIMTSLIEGPVKDTTINADIINLSKMYFYIKKVKGNIKIHGINNKIISDILYTLHSEYRPILINQSYRSIEYIKLIDTLESLMRDFATPLLLKNEILSNNQSKMPSFLIIASKLYQFDKTATFSEYLKLIEDVGKIFPNDDVKNVLSTVITFVKDYTAIEEYQNGKEVINFNVESFIAKFQTIKPYKLNRWQLNMTVGVNNAYFFKDLALDDGSITRNLNYVGEKVGVKFKLYDFSFQQNRNPGETFSKRSIQSGFRSKSYIRLDAPQEPFISNCHLILYGSGLLYNLVNTKSNKEFNMPLIGFGIGTTFFNALDFNVSLGVPIFSDSDFIKSFDNYFVNIGFDIQFIEYYNRLQEKRNANKTQKKLNEARKAM